MWNRISRSAPGWSASASASGRRLERERLGELDRKKIAPSSRSCSSADRSSVRAPRYGCMVDRLVSRSLMHGVSVDSRILGLTHSRSLRDADKPPVKRMHP